MNENLLQKDAFSVINEAAGFFKEQGLSVLNNGFAEIVSDPRMSKSYVDALMEGVDANNQAEMSQLMTNSNTQILFESISGIAPISSLTMPVIRMLWPRVVMKQALKTKVATTPIFSIAYQKPYLSKWVDGTETRIELPRGAFTHDTPEGTEETQRFTSNWDDSRKVDVVTAVTAGTFTSGVKLLGADVNLQKTPLDAHVELVSVLAGADADTAVEYYIGKKVGLEPVIVADVKVGEETAQVIVKIDFKAAEAQVAVLGTTAVYVAVKTRAYKSSEWNEVGFDVNFDIKRQEITIGTGDHLNAPLSVEYLQDVQALYNINAANEVADLMTQTFAQKLDYEIIDFMIDCYLKRPRNTMYPAKDGYAAYSNHLYTFDCHPAAGFAGAQTEWFKQIYRVIDIAATNLMRETYFQGGTFVITGNPLDTSILRHVDWQYKASTGGNVDGVNINYEMGVFTSSTYQYKVVSSLNFEPGKLLLSFIPSGDKQLCQVYYPYSFVVEKGNGYRSPNHSLVPSIMMTKRHTMHEVMPCTALVVIENNDGSFNGGNIWTNQFVAQA